MEKNEINHKIKKALDELYKENPSLFDKNLCERCINHRFATYLEQQNFGEGYFVDCEYNKSHLHENTSAKRVLNPNGNYIDIIITKRDGDYRNDFICFEVKRWDNYKNRKKDRENLEILTAGVRFGYDYGFYIILGATREKTKIKIYQNGKMIN
ncbi:MAG: hypothetical protein WC697_00975 [Patescibacteria group bacterium]|jgi:hypothetical protein